MQENSTTVKREFVLESEEDLEELEEVVSAEANRVLNQHGSVRVRVGFEDTLIATTAESLMPSSSESSSVDHSTTE